MKKTVISIILALFIAMPLANVFAYGTNYRYTGKPFDPDVNLYDYEARSYQPDIGRFTQPDPLQNYLNDPEKLKQLSGKQLDQILSNPQGLNPYSYVQNNPVKYVDPNGHQAIEAVGVVGGAVWASPNIYNYGKALSQGNLTEASNQASQTLNKIGIGLIAGIVTDLAIRAIPLASGILSLGNLTIQNSDKFKEYTVKYGSEIGDSMVQASKVFDKAGLKYEEHALLKTVTRLSRGITSEKVVDVIKNGEKYFDTLNQNYSYFQNGIRVAVNQFTNVINTVVEQKTIDSIRFFLLKK